MSEIRLFNFQPQKFREDLKRSKKVQREINQDHPRIVVVTLNKFVVQLPKNLIKVYIKKHVVLFHEYSNDFLEYLNTFLRELFQI